MNTFDLFVQSYFSSVRTASSTEFMYIITSFFDITTFVMIGVCFALLVYLVRGARYAIFFSTTIVVAGGMIALLKSLFNTARPLDGVIHVLSPSFPSGHATIATVFFVTLMYIFDTYLGRFGRIMFNALCVASIFLIALSRVYLGVHWVSDVVAGIVLGALISYGSILVFAFFNSKNK